MRLKKRREFLAVAATRQKWVTPGLILQVRQHDEDERFEKAPSSGAPDKTEANGSDIIRVGFTTSKKVGGAVERNRARRRLRALAAEILPENALPGVDLVIIGRRSTVTRPWDALRGDLSQSLKKLGLARRKPGQTGDGIKKA